MKVPLSWLRDVSTVDRSAEDVASRLSVRGFAVEGIESLPDGDAIIDFEVTANRPDCMSVRGLGREAAAAFGRRLGPAPAGPALAIAATPRVPIRIEASQFCPRYAGALARVRVASSPEWMQARLRACGVRPINNVVDVTNYVLLELGQPMHAFDVSRLAGPEIVVRMARPGETLRTLDGQDRPLTPAMLVIADAARATAVAGVMGGAESEVSESTTHILLESAYFDPLSVRRTSKALGLKTEASMRFERGADPALPAVALARACALLAEIGAGVADGDMVDRHPRPSTPRTLTLRRQRLAAVLGFSVPDDAVGDILAALGCDVSAADDGWRIGVPSWRVDLAREVDIIEEVARHHGFDKVPTTFPALRHAPPPSDPRVESARHLRSVLTGAGFFEAMTFGFMPEVSALPFSAAAELVPLANPLSETFAVLRPSIVPGLIAAVAHNRHREQSDVRLFEIGACFTRSGGERRTIALAFTGAADPPFWGAGTTATTFFDAKAAAERVGLALGVTLSVHDKSFPWLSAGQSAELRCLNVPVGYLGRLAPALAESHGLTKGEHLFVVEIDLDAAARPNAASLRVLPLPRFPSVSRDVALLVDQGLAAATLRNTVRAAAPATLASVREFDRYQGKGVPEGKVSLALRLTFRSAERTLTDAEVQQAVERVLDAVREHHAAIQR